MSSASPPVPAAIGNFDLAVNYAYTGKTFPDPANQFPLKATNIVNGSITWTSANDKWNVKLWAKNLTGLEYYNHLTVSSGRVAISPAPPRFRSTPFILKKF